MTKWKVICAARATIQEVWHVDADSAESAREIMEDYAANGGEGVEFIGQDVDGEEEGREVRCVLELPEDFAPTPCPECNGLGANPKTGEMCDPCLGGGERRHTPDCPATDGFGCRCDDLRAAPNLLAAAQAVLDGGSWNDDGSFVYWPPDGAADDDEGAIGDLSAAIAKATGAATVKG
ncbi:hypothetical protein OOT33_13790 [Sphingobium sp. DEHP117]|uniref:hypothetical protein n=1 Tax=Sphingobium sp. DEHP117 TaxID=2993436 RepID=UPI0027D768A1|nr:hypothetical protein [Sphingobium sp. DEHP117]MDQ4421495.1 hypothetical protein [Sphingobium sp. DEHP117]